MAVRRDETAVETMQPDFLGSIDIGAGMGPNAWNAVQGVPDANLQPDFQWERKTAIDRATPRARPGYVQRWVRIRDIYGKPDVANKAEAQMEGWVPRRADSLESRDRAIPVYDPGDGKGGVIVFKEELLLCEMPVETHQRLLNQLDQAQEAINRAVYEQTRGGAGENLPSRFARLDFDNRDTAELVD